MDRKRLAILAGTVAGICVVALTYHLTQSVALSAALMASVNGGVWWVSQWGNGATVLQERDDKTPWEPR